MSSTSLDTVELSRPAPILSSAVLAICPICHQGFSPKTNQKFCSNKCRQKSFWNTFKARTGKAYKSVPRTPRPKPSKRCVSRHRPGARTRLDTTVLAIKIRGVPYIRVTICVGQIRREKNIQIAKIGMAGAKMAAALLRLSWLIELGVWNPRDGDPFEILSYANSLKGNHEYENSAVDGVSSPWILEREDA